MPDHRSVADGCAAIRHSFANLDMPTTFAGATETNGPVGWRGVRRSTER